MSSFLRPGYLPCCIPRPSLLHGPWGWVCPHRPEHSALVSQDIAKQVFFLVCLGPVPLQLLPSPFPCCPCWALCCHLSPPNAGTPSSPSLTSPSELVPLVIQRPFQVQSLSYALQTLFTPLTRIVRSRSWPSCCLPLPLLPNSMGAHDWAILPTQHLSPSPYLPRTPDSLRSGLWSRPSHRPQASCPVPAGFNCTEFSGVANHSAGHYRSSSSRGGDGEKRQACGLDSGCLQAPRPVPRRWGREGLWCVALLSPTRFPPPAWSHSERAGLASPEGGCQGRKRKGAGTGESSGGPPRPLPHRTLGSLLQVRPQV